MGNASTKERSSSPGNDRYGASSSSTLRRDRHNGESSSSHLGRLSMLGSGGETYPGRSRSRTNLEQTLFGLGVVSSREQRERDREAEREAREQRRLEREKERLKERERSLKEDRVDGGFLVTLGVYTGVEDFNTKVVRHLMIERRLAPFFKGLPDHEDNWTDAQLVAAVHGLPIPPADAQPPVELPSSLPAKAAASTDNLTVPIASRSRSHSCASDLSNRSSSPTATSTRARSKTLMAAISSPKNLTKPNTVGPAETNTPSKLIDGRPIEAVLYKNAMECPICFLYYPPYMNKTRCCDQEICSECFVQIKRADPHLPEHHGDAPPSEEQQALGVADQLISEPASCPFCKQPDFGVVYTPPPFRRGLVYVSQANATANPLSAVGSGSHSSSSSSLQASSSTPPASPGGRRRLTFTKDAPEVVTTDRIRPDWAQKLATARSHAARRAAAATALHTATFLMPSPSSGSSSGGGFPGRRLMRRSNRDGNGSESPSPGASGSGTPREEGTRSSTLLHLGGSSRERQRQTDTADDRLASFGFISDQRHRHNRGNLLDIGNSREHRRSRVDDLEEMMLMEAIRLSLQEEEDRKRREEKEAAERKAKEEQEKENQKLLAARSHETTALSSSPPVEGKGKSVDRSGSPVAEQPSLPDIPSPAFASSSSQPQQTTASSSSDASSLGSSSEAEKVTPDYFRSGHDTPENAGSGEESMFNFRSLAEMIEEEEIKHDKDDEREHVEHVEHGVPMLGSKVQRTGNVDGKCAEITMERIGDEQSA